MLGSIKKTATLATLMLLLAVAPKMVYAADEDQENFDQASIEARDANLPDSIIKRQD